MVKPEACFRVWHFDIGIIHAVPDIGTGHMTAKYKMALTAGVARLIFESFVKPEYHNKIELNLIRECNYEDRNYVILIPTVVILYH